MLLVKPLPKIEGRRLTELASKDTWRLRGRLAIEEMYETVSAACSLTFDFCSLVVLAAWIASVGERRGDDWFVCPFE